MCSQICLCFEVSSVKNAFCFTHRLYVPKSGFNVLIQQKDLVHVHLLQSHLIMKQSLLYKFVFQKFCLIYISNCTVLYHF